MKIRKIIGFQQVSRQKQPRQMDADEHRGHDEQRKQDVSQRHDQTSFITSLLAPPKISINGSSQNFLRAREKSQSSTRKDMVEFSQNQIKAITLMVYFAWVKNQQAWMPIAATPQIIHDEEMAAYVVRQGHLVIVKKHQLTETEAKLPFGQLVKRYPLQP